MQKKAENTFSISKFIQKYIKNGKKKAHLFRFVSLLYPLCILFLHFFFKPKNSYKKRQKCKNAKMQKKSIKLFSNCKNKHTKKAWNDISKKDEKKTEMQKKKLQKKAGGCNTQNYTVQNYTV